MSGDIRNCETSVLRLCYIIACSPVVGRGILKGCVKEHTAYPLFNDMGSRPKGGDTPPMSKETINGNTESRPDWKHLEDWLRDQV